MIRYSRFYEENGINHDSKQGRFFLNTDISNDYITNNFYYDYLPDISDFKKLEEFIYNHQKYGMDFKIDPNSNLTLFLVSYDNFLG